MNGKVPTVPGPPPSTARQIKRSMAWAQIITLDVRGQRRLGVSLDRLASPLGISAHTLDRYLRQLEDVPERVKECRR